jgi:hypothetical protein
MTLWLFLVVLYILFLSGVASRLFWKSQRKFADIFLLAVSFVLTILEASVHDWIMTVLYGLCVVWTIITDFQYKEKIKNNKP